MRRDVSGTRTLQALYPMSSLHAQRCFFDGALPPAFRIVFSACAEMFLVGPAGVHAKRCLLCMRRDVSVGKWVLSSWMRSSLHAQRCFWQRGSKALRFHVFSACAKMFLLEGSETPVPVRLLCMRRDVSPVVAGIMTGIMSSLHAQRCFYLLDYRFDASGVFSACAAMFLRQVDS